MATTSKNRKPVWVPLVLNAEHLDRYFLLLAAVTARLNLVLFVTCARRYNPISSENRAEDMEMETQNRKYLVVRDCLLQIDDSVNQLSQSIGELRRLDPKARMTGDIFWHIDNVDAWVSAALTDASSCVDEFPGHWMSKMKASIKSKVLNVAQLTSNALALFHQYSARYRAAAIEKHP
ncbi:hypothetical protein HRI_001253000 [Hibiscus trionum]|uniref:Pectinesterase inhibitor domain-containing protein n=1 Tax=Hibiscus trionum TaxID=183268 RepID=A0A9W7HF60_HIBTR|nr:hypothetical protein HRI_001253000 [Hibiscus trionum]